MKNLENQTELVKGDWYVIEFDGCYSCLLQYNDDKVCTGWWNGTYAEYDWNFSKKGLGSFATPAPLELLRERGLAL